MLKSLVEKVDIYLVVLILITCYILIFSDVKYFLREKNERARKQSLNVGLTMLVVFIGIYIFRLIWF